MTLSIERITNLVAGKFPNVERLEDGSVIRFTKGFDGVDFAVYYLEVGDNLPRDPEDLTRYQDRVVGSRYFEGRKSLQWNNYLYFITSEDYLASSSAQLAKDFIEADRAYSRKLVISEEEIESILLSPVLSTSGDPMSSNILTTWTELLTQGGLYEAIFDDNNIPNRLNLITAPQSEPMPQIATEHLPREVEAPPFIQSIELKSYRPFPVQRHFDFGTVNLIHGANGSGKTSLLEAIELFYCGKNNRNRSHSNPYELVANLAGDVSQTSTHRRQPSIFRKRNLDWYGQMEVKTNNLFQSFARFNFLDTDAAVSLGTTTGRMEENLSQLLIGPNASKTWQNIERVGDALSSQLRSLRQTVQTNKYSLADAEKKLAESENIPMESVHVQSRLQEILIRLGWDDNQIDKNTVPDILVQELAELVSIASRLVNLEWITRPVSVDGVNSYRLEAFNKTENSRDQIARLEGLQKNRSEITESADRYKEFIALVEEAKRLIDARVPERAAELNNLEIVVANRSGWLAGIDSVALSNILATYPGMSLAACYEVSVSALSTADVLLENANERYRTFSSLMEESRSLGQQLRAIASRILRTNHTPDQCPLCHTHFETGELQRLIDIEVENQLEEQAQGILAQLPDLENDVQQEKATVAALEWLRGFSAASGLTDDTIVSAVIGEVEDVRHVLEVSNQRIEALSSELHGLQIQGLTIERFRTVVDELSNSGFTWSEFSLPEGDRLVLSIDLALIEASKSLETVEAEIYELQIGLEATLGIAGSEIQGLNNELSRLIEQITEIDLLLKRMDDFSSRYPWPTSRPLTELVVEAESVRTVSVDFQGTMARERSAVSENSEASQRKKGLESELSEMKPRLQRWSDANSTLDFVRKEYSLTDAMAAALQQNRGYIEDIYSRIHAPAEFSGLGSDWTTLVRKIDGRESALSQISSGQRSALALAIFLAQNSQLRSAPPVILIDDPIAHVDDLNALSFLDYLRELALTENRQIFFATANDKLATLFGRKFDFMGEDKFQRINLTR